MDAAAYCKNIPWILVGLKKDLRDDEETIERLLMTKQHPVAWKEVRFLTTTMNETEVQADASVGGRATQKDRSSKLRRMLSTFKRRNERCRK
jgi:hypothetical protein